MSVEIDPLELGFRRPFTAEVSQVLKIKNPNPAPVAFKVKTTAPKRYCVRPNSGRVEPGHEVEVVVLLQAMKQEPAPDEKCRDKFLVQSVIVTGDKEFMTAQQIWDSVDKTAVQEKKIRVNWYSQSDDALHPQAAVVTPARQSLANEAEATAEAPPSYSSPSDNASTTSATAAPEPDKESGIGREPPAEPAPASIREELKESFVKVEEKLAPAVESAASVLRQRRAPGAVGDKGLGVGPGQQEPRHATSELGQATRQGTEGVPIKVVAILCLVSFLLGYLFF